MDILRLNPKLVYRTGQQPSPRPHYSRQQIPQRPNYPVYEDFEFRHDSTREPPRSRRCLDVPRSDPRYGPDAALVDEMYLNRRPSTHSCHQNPPLPNQAYPRTPAEPHRLLFDHAASSLYNTLISSRTFLIDLLDAFDHEIAGIKSYAEPKVLESLWRRKVEKLDEDGAKQMDLNMRLQREPQNVPRNPNLPPPPPSSLQPVQTFYSTSGYLLDALKTAAVSVPRRTQIAPPPPPPSGFVASPVPPPPPPPSPRSEEDLKEEVDNMERLIKKLRGQFKDLRELIEGSKKSARKCGELVKDLAILLDVLNNSGDLWRQGSVNEG